jgi:hypothetical protein
MESIAKAMLLDFEAMLEVSMGILLDSAAIRDPWKM